MAAICSTEKPASIACNARCQTTRVGPRPSGTAIPPGRVVCHERSEFAPPMNVSRSGRVSNENRAARYLKTRLHRRFTTG